MRRSGRPRLAMAPGGFVLALAAARKSVARAFCFGGGSTSRGHVARRSSGGKRLFGGRFAAEKKPGSAGSDAGCLASTPPESPFPPGSDEDLVSFFLLRHGQTNFNAIGRIQVRASLLGCTMHDEEVVHQRNTAASSNFQRTVGLWHVSNRTQTIDLRRRFKRPARMVEGGQFWFFGYLSF